MKTYIFSTYHSSDYTSNSWQYVSASFNFASNHNSEEGMED